LNYVKKFHFSRRVCALAINCHPYRSEGGEWMKRETAAPCEVSTGIDAAIHDSRWPKHYDDTPPGEFPADHFVERDGVVFAGTHLLLDFWGARHLDDLKIVEAALRRSVDRCNATLLHIHLHHFTPNGGISGVAVLAESHISVHTWPERDFAAFDIFMCGDTRPEAAIPLLKRVFSPETVKINERLRGIVRHA
jgi:S-adenosylmethionine decarboxylase